VSNWTRVFNTRVQFLKFYLIKKKLYLKKNNSLTRVFNTRVKLDACQIGRVYTVTEESSMSHYWKTSDFAAESRKSYPSA
jgi:hypothetical protein